MKRILQSEQSKTYRMSKACFMTVAASLYLRIAVLLMEVCVSTFWSYSSQIATFHLMAADKNTFTSNKTITSCLVKSRKHCEKLCDITTTCESYWSVTNLCHLYSVVFTKARMQKAQAVLGAEYYYKEVGRVPRCPTGYHYDQDADMCMKLVMRESNCSEHAEHSKLAILNSDKKHKAVVSYLNQQDYTYDVAVGGRKNLTGGYFWLTGEEIKGANWCPDQPTGRACVSLWAQYNFCLDDSWCTNLLDKICEVPVHNITGI